MSQFDSVWDALERERQQPEAQGGESPFAHVWDALEKEQPKQNLKSALRTSPDATPDQAVQDVRLGRELNMPPDMVGMDRKAAQDVVKERQLLRDTEGADYTAAWLAATPWNVRAAEDDVRNLAGIEKALKDRGLEGAGISAAKSVARLPGSIGKARGRTRPKGLRSCTRIR
ncbi:MAG: hypothetical protein LBO64_10430 [Desulfovibrio sp.]|jgi:hypothetical protein|nr:hypothetical protein [Desulfovibrio sp.]